MHTPEPSADGLLTLLAVARTGRYTAAADLLGINHTTASRRVAALEQALGGPLLARGAAGWELTELGRAQGAGVAPATGAEHDQVVDTAVVLDDLVRDPPQRALNVTG